MPKVPDEQRVFFVEKPPGSATFIARISIANGQVKEEWDTGQKTEKRAQVYARRYVRTLYKRHAIETPRAYQKRTGSTLSLWMIRKGFVNGTLDQLERSHGGDKVTVNRKGSKAPIQFDDEDQEPDDPPERQSNGRSGNDWMQSLVRIENKFAQAFTRILNVCLLGVGDDDPQTFRDHVRAIVTETTLSGITPTGRLQRKRGRPPGV